MELLSRTVVQPLRRLVQSDFDFSNLGDLEYDDEYEEKPFEDAPRRSLSAAECRRCCCSEEELLFPPRMTSSMYAQRAPPSEPGDSVSLTSEELRFESEDEEEDDEEYTKSERNIFLRINAYSKVYVELYILELSLGYQHCIH